MVALWEACNLVRPWNDPRKDIARKLEVCREMFIVTDGDAIVGPLMAGTRVIGDGSVTSRWSRVDVTRVLERRCWLRPSDSSLRIVGHAAAPLPSKAAS